MTFRSFSSFLAVLATVAATTVASAQPYFTQTQVLTVASNSTSRFAWTIDVDGEWAVASDPSSNQSIARVIVYRKVGGTWTSFQTLTCPAVCSFFGIAGAVSGNTIAVASPNGTVNGALVLGSVYVYTWTGSTWAYSAELPLPAGRGPTAAGALDLAGDTLVVGAGTTSAQDSSNSAYVFQRSGGTWTRSELVRTAPISGELFGVGVSVSGDSVCVAAPNLSPPPGGVYVFRNTGSGWAQEGPRLAPGLYNYACAIDGNTLAIGAPTGGSGGGRVHVLQRSGSTWTLQQNLTTASAANYMGDSVAVRGNELIAGIRNTTPGSSGAALFAKVNGRWVERGVAASPVTAGVFGQSVATDGTTMMAAGSRSGSGGAVAVYEANGTPPGSALPSAPQNVAATVSGNTVNMSWSSPASGTAPFSYTVIARTSPGGPIVASVATGGALGLNVAAPNGTYVVSVRASNALGVGLESAGVTISVPATVPAPTAPSALTATVSGSTVTFAWAAPSGGGAVAGYTLLAGLTPNFTTAFATLPLPASPRSLAVPLVPAGTYYVRMVAQNSGGTSPPSNEVTFTVAGLTVPSAPTLGAPSVTGNTVSLSWTAGPGGGTPTSYLLTATTPAGAVIATVPLTGTAASFAGVPAGSYRLRLAAVNGAGTSPASNEVTLVVP